MMKECTKCRKLLDESEFSKDVTKKDGMQSHCKSCHKHHYTKNRAHRMRYQREYEQTDSGRASQHKHNQARRNLGFTPLNNKFDDSEFHHLHLDGNTDIGIYIPRELHNVIYHNSNTWQGMDEINIIALLYLAQEHSNGFNQYCD